MDEVVSTPSPRPFLKIRPAIGWAKLDLWEVWQFRDLLKVLTSRDLKLRYKQTALGVAWVILLPLLSSLIFSIVFGILARFDPPKGVPYFVFVFVGMVGWNLFSQAVQKTSVCLVGNAQLVTKVYFPRLVLPLSNVGSVFVDFCFCLVMMLVFLLAVGHVPDWHILFLPVWVLALVMLATGLGMITSSLAVNYRDVNYIVPVVLQLMLYATPVAYSMEQISTRLAPESKLYLLYNLNPMTTVLEGFRWSVLGQGQITVSGLIYTFSVAIILMAVGMVQFKRLERRFADVI